MVVEDQVVEDRVEAGDHQDHQQSGEVEAGRLVEHLLVVVEASYGLLEAVDG